MPKNVWISNESGRSLFGWKIKEEIFAIFFILVILSLSSNEKIVEKVSNNTSIQLFIVIIFIYCLYNKIPWSLAFILVFVFSMVFSDFTNKIKTSLQKIFDDNKLTDSKKNNTFIEIGAKVLGWISKDSKKETPKSILKKKVRFEDKKEDTKKDTKDTKKDNKEDTKEDTKDNNHICKKVEELFGLDEETDCESEYETDCETDGESIGDSLNLKDDLKSFMKNNLSIDEK